MKIKKIKQVATVEKFQQIFVIDDVIAGIKNN